MRRRRHRHRHHVGVVADQADRREIGHRIERQGREQKLVHRERHRLQQHGVAVRVGLGDRVGADRGRAAALVLDHHLLAPDRRQLGGDDARDGVGAAAGRKRHDEADEARRIGCACAARARRKRRRQRGCGRKRDEAPAVEHRVLPGRRRSDGVCCRSLGGVRPGRATGSGAIRAGLHPRPCRRPRRRSRSPARHRRP